MSNTRYIELDSTYRDRNQFPLPANFEVRLSEGGSAPKNGVNAIDPVLESFPTPIWSAAFDRVGPAAFVTGTFDLSGGFGIGATSGSLDYIIVTAGASLQQADNFYRGAIIEDTTTTERRRIEDYRYLGSNRAQITVDRTFSDSISDGDAFRIENPSDFTANSQIFVSTGVGADEFYRGKVIQRTPTGATLPTESTTVSEYDGVTRIAELTTAFAGPIAATDTFQIRDVDALISGTLAAGGSTTTFVLPSGASATVGNYIRTNITAYPITSADGVLATASAGDVRRIIAYNPGTRVGTVTPAFSADPSGNTFEILQFTRDNVVPMNYTGSKVSQTQEVCYQVELLTLILPNQVLVTGSRVTFYPFVYVEFTNLGGASGHNSNVIYSNNPNSVKALFKAPITDVPNLITSSFMKIDSDGMIQTVKFKPNDSFRFRVFLPNGDTFETVTSDNLSPLEPNPLIQISATFAITRVV